MFLPILHVTPIFLLIILAFSINNLYRAKFGERFDYSNLEYKGYEEKTTFVCHLHTKFVTSPFLHLLALDGGCPECRQYRAEHMNSAMTTEEYIEQAKIAHGETYDYTPTDYRSYKKK